MESVKIYLSGGISNLSKEEQSGWRNRFKDAIKFGDHDLIKTPIFFDPTQYYSIFIPEHNSEREVMDFDLYNLRNSDLVVVNFNDPKSIGTAMELAIANERKIPVIGLVKHGVKLHPWLSESCIRICDNFAELAKYVVKYYLT